MFVAGDRVRCTRNNAVWFGCHDFSLTIGEVFTVEFESDGEVKLENDPRLHCTDRFEKVHTSVAAFIKDHLAASVEAV